MEIEGEFALHVKFYYFKLQDIFAFYYKIIRALFDYLAHVDDIFSVTPVRYVPQTLMKFCDKACRQFNWRDASGRSIAMG